MAETENGAAAQPQMPQMKIIGQFIRDLSFVAEAGKTTALVGPSGGGKSTIIALLQRFYATEEGMITVDGQDISKISTAALRSNIAYVSQAPVLFQGTVRANLRTLADRAAPLIIETPDGSFLEPDWRNDGPGSYNAEVPVDQLGLYRALSGGLEAVALNGPANPREFAALEATGEVLAPLVESSGGGTYALERVGDRPDIRMVGRRADAAGSNWLGLKQRGAYAVRSSTSLPLLPGLLAIGLILFALLFAWRREGR